MSRRQPGEGSVTSYSNASGDLRWRCQWRELKDASNPRSGKRTVGRAGFRTQKQARAVLREQLVLAARGKTTTRSRTTFDSYARRWLAVYSCQPSTRLYIQRVLDAVQPHIGGVDYAARLVLAELRWRFVRSNLLDLAALALPLLRPLRLLRLVALLSVLNRPGAHTLRGRVATYVAAGSALLIFAGALAITDAEWRSPDATITGFADGLWWATTTVTTVGYGDRYPVTTTGRFVALALMIGGVALLGVVTATLASWLVERVRADNEEEATATRAQVTELTEQVRALTAQIEKQIAGTDPRTRANP